MNAVTLLNERRQHLSQLAICIEILKVYNCRAGEVLSAEWAKYHKDKFLILSAEKKSSNVIIRDRFILQQIEQLPVLHPTKIFPSVNYGILYRHCKKYYSHLFVKFKGRTRYKVTHGFRYYAVNTIDIETEIRDILHHRSIKSGKYYK